jgi:hypothetical protein
MRRRLGLAELLPDGVIASLSPDRVRVRPLPLRPDTPKESKSGLGAKLGANDHRIQATPSLAGRLNGQVSATSGCIRHHLAMS